VTFVDTNILLHAINTDSECHASCATRLEHMTARAEPWAISWSVLYEFLRVATHPRVFPNPMNTEHAWSFLQELVSQPSCTIIAETPLHAEVLADCLAESPRLSGNILHDFHSSVLMREHGIRQVLTLDRDFHAFPWVEVELP
jgi:toxin-antitoxin system PIN domain toxin